MVVEGECVACESPDETKLAVISQLVSLGDRWVHKGSLYCYSAFICEVSYNKNVLFFFYEEKADQCLREELLGTMIMFIILNVVMVL